jgi:lysozyme family protein
MQTWQSLIDDIIEREGGFTNHPADRGGPTKYGITQATLAVWRGHPVTIDEVRDLDIPETRQIYKARYVVAPGFDHPSIGELLCDQLVDYGVNSGPGVAIMKLQAVLGVPADGKLGPMTYSALAAANQQLVNNKLVVERVLMIGRIVCKVPTQLVFLMGWLTRAVGFFHFEQE